MSRLSTSAVGTRSQAHRVTAQESGEFSDFERGGETWSDVRDLWVEIKPMRGNELQHARQLQPTTTHKVRTSWVAGIHPGMRLERGDGRILEIQSVINVNERNRWLEMLCIEAE